MAALIPLSEFSDPGVMKKYGVKPDPETLDILSTAASQKDVISFLLELNLEEYQTLIWGLHFVDPCFGNSADCGSPEGLLGRPP